ncbi:MAG: ABC transporter permease [Candidatus Omnitrophica bacterium]|nr:ABC transporter permease [Candidatus Omnitrophota bacterium]
MTNLRSDLIGFKSLVEREIIRFTSVFKQTIFPPIISSFLFISVFGLFLGKGIENIQGVSYLTFLVPGLMMMYLIEGSYLNTSTSLFVARWAGHIQEILVTPLSYFEMVAAMLIGGLARSVAEAFGIYLVSLLFTSFPIVHPWAVFYFAILVSLSFSSIGMIIGLLAEEWEHLSILTTFVITPLVYFGGVFHSIDMIPPSLQFLMYLNPTFYMMNGMRYGMLGILDANLLLSALVVFFFFISLFSVTVYMFKTGYKLKK